MLKAVLHGEPIRGTWINRTQKYRAKLRRKKSAEPESFASEETAASGAWHVLKALKNSRS